MADLAHITNIANQTATLITLDEIAEILKVDIDNPALYCVYKSCNKEKLTEQQLKAVDMAIKVLKERHQTNLKQNVNYMDKHLIQPNINDDSN